MVAPSATIVWLRVRFLSSAQARHRRQPRRLVRQRGENSRRAAPSASRAFLNFAIARREAYLHASAFPPAARIWALLLLHEFVRSRLPMDSGPVSRTSIRDLLS